MQWSTRPLLLCVKSLALSNLSPRSNNANRPRFFSLTYPATPPFPKHLMRRSQEMMNALWARLDKAITTTGGMVVAHMGDGVMAVWGCASAQEDDPERAIRGALAMQAALGDYVKTSLRLSSGCRQSTDNTPSLRMRIGINTGPSYSARSQPPRSSQHWVILQTLPRD